MSGWWWVPGSGISTTVRQSPPRRAGALLHCEHALSEGSRDLGMCKGFTPFPSCWEEDYSLEIQPLDKHQRRKGKMYVKEHSFYIANVHIQQLTGTNKSLLLGHLWKQDLGSLKHFWTHCLLVPESSPCLDFCGVSLDVHKDKHIWPGHPSDNHPAIYGYIFGLSSWPPVEAYTFNNCGDRYVSQDGPGMQLIIFWESVHAAISNSPKLSTSNGLIFPFPFPEGIYSNDKWI